MNYGPITPECDAIHAAKYRGPSESFEEACNRQAAILAPGEDFKVYRDIILNQRFLPAGRIQSAIGSTRNVTPYNCFVSGTISDSLRDGDGAITKRLDEALATLQMGGGIGYDFSPLRPRGALIKKLQTHSSGPLPFMGIFNAGCICISAAGHRRGAQMGVLRVDHPDIEEFIHAKQKGGVLEAFNLSIAVTDDFMEAVRDDNLFGLNFGGQHVRDVRARDLWEMIMRSTWDWGEPGVLFIDRINSMNNLWYAETIAATNPCGEQPLPPHGACLLGSFNLVKYLQHQPARHTDDGGAGYYFDFDQFKADIPEVVRAMDNVIDVATYPLPEQQEEAVSKRRMGLGVTGVANALEAMGHSYGGEGFVDALAAILTLLRNTAYQASIDLAKEKGPFPLFDVKYSAGEFIQTLPIEMREEIRKHGIRNSHLLSIAPTGTISLCADNVSSGIEPVFAFEVEREIIGPDMVARTHRFQDYGFKQLGVDGLWSHSVTAAEHLGVLATAQLYMDSAVSKTINVNGSMPWEKFKDIYMNAWELGCKGCTTFNSDGKRGSVISCAITGECE